MSYTCAPGWLLCVSCKCVGVLAVLSVRQWLSVAVKRHWQRHRDDCRVASQRAKVISLTARPNSVVCQPPLAPLAAIVPTAVNHAAYESEQQSIAPLMNPNSSQLLSAGTHCHIWGFQPVTWIASDRTSWRQTEINRNKYQAGKAMLCLSIISSSWKSLQKVKSE